MAQRRCALALHSLGSGQETLIVLSYPLYPQFAKRSGISPLSPTKKAADEASAGSLCTQDTSGPFGTCTHARTGPHNGGEKGSKGSGDQPR